MTTSIERLRARLDQARADGDQGAAMLITIIFMVVVSGFMMVLLAALIAQLQPTQIAEKRTRTVYAAESGLQAALSVMRSNTVVVGTGASAVTYGDPTKLPNTLSGTVDGTATSDLQYVVNISYFDTSPEGKDAAWRAAHAMSYPLSSSPTQQPSFAFLESTGTDSAEVHATSSLGDRTIVAVYEFKTTTKLLPGGKIYLASNSQCVKAASATAGSLIVSAPIAECGDDALTTWVYDTDWRLKLGSTVGSSEVLCVTGRKWAATSNGFDPAVPLSTLARASLQPCTSPNSGAYGNQLWSWDDWNSWVGQNFANTARSGLWLQFSGGVLHDATGYPTNLSPEPTVGAGAASKSTNQIVNYREFGRCMDVTDNNLSKTFMIVYPCKQDPTGTGAQIAWNHKWTYDEPPLGSATSAPQSIYVINGGNRYCLTAQTSTTDTVMRLCNSADPQQKFVRNVDTGDKLSSWTFQLANDRTKCLAAVPEPGYGWSHLRLVPCDGSTAQRWNAPAEDSSADFGGFEEVG